MTKKIARLLAEARKLGLSDRDCRCVGNAHGALPAKEVIKALERFIIKGIGHHIEI